MNRARPINVFLCSLFSAIMSVSVLSGIHAQTNRNSASDPKRYERMKWTQVPAEFTRRQFSPTRAPGDSGVLRQTTLLTYTYNPTNPAVQPNIPSASQDLHPAWSSDERYIYFDSDRTNETNTKPVSPSVYTIYRMNSDGSGVTQILASGTNKIEPSISYDNAKLAYVGGGNLSPTSSGFKLYVISFNTNNVIDLTSQNPSGFTFLDVRRPTWSPAGNEIAFAGRISSDPNVSHLFKVNTDTGVVTQLTSGLSNDYSPSWSQDGHLIAFTSNAKTFSTTSPVITTTVAGNDDIWVISPSPFQPNAKKVTGFSVNGVATSNRNPAWSTLKVDPGGYVPTGTSGGVTTSVAFLAFASTRADSLNDGRPDSVVSTTDIYFLSTPIAPDPNVTGGYTVTTPESVGNAAIKLRTSTPDVAIDPTDPNANFDRAHTSNEDFPAWPQYINSYRITYQSDRGNNLNLWASTVIDINAPTILRYDLQSGNIIGVFNDNNAPAPGSDSSAQIRQLAAGDTVRFRARVADYESGVAAVYVQIKNPNSDTQDSKGIEHKVFYAIDATVENSMAGTGSHVPRTPIEYDAQAINPSTYAYKPDGNVEATIAAQVAAGGISVPSTWPGWNRYVASIDDFAAFTGSPSVSPPDTDYWLQLYDDGDETVGGHEPHGEVKGDGIYTNKWITPIDQPSDWYLDLIVRDRAINPYNPRQSSNWKIYDNLWGFTTQTFVAKGTILYVNDYDSGQKFFSNRFNTGVFGSTSTSWAGIPTQYTGVPTESWMTNIRQNLIPTTFFTGTTANALRGLLQTMGPHSYGADPNFLGYYDPLTDDGSGVPVTQKYDQWRVLSRGAIPQGILDQYGAHIDTQPSDVTNANANAIKVTVAEKCVIWHAPYAGDLFVGNGTIADSSMQNELNTFMQNGGRVFLSGQDVAFALTLGTPGASAFLKTNFGVDFSRDFPGGSFPFPILPQPDNAVALVGGTTIHPIATEYWFDGTLHNYFDYTTTRTYAPPSSGPIYLADTGPTALNEYGANNNLSPDVITFIPEVKDISAIDGKFAGAGNPVIVWRTVVGAAGTPEQRSVFSPIPWESINPSFYSRATGLEIARGRRAELIHNVGDYLRTGRIFGSVRDVNGATPLGKAFVRATDDYTGKVGTAVTQSDGSYTITGLVPNSGYTIDTYLQGYLVSHVDRVNFHGSYQARSDIFLQKAQNGSIAGKVTVNGSSPAVPVPGAIVRATDPISGTFYEATTLADGTYTILNVPTLSDPANPNSAVGYIVRITNLAALGYGSSTPTTYGVFPTDDAATIAGKANAVPVGTNQSVTGINFALKPIPGSITGKVTKRDVNGVDTGTGIAGATVTAIAGTVTLTATTATDGTYTIAAVDPGTWSVYASAPGFKDSDKISVTVSSKTATPNINFALYRQQPGSISGLVSNASGIAVVGATVSVTDSAGNPLKDADGNVIASVTTTTLKTSTDGTYTYNYIVSAVPAGKSLQVTASKSGYTNKTGTLTVDVVTQVETKNVNFILTPLASFSQNRQLVSAPYTYSVSVATLLNLSASAQTGLRFFTYVPTSVNSGSYVQYPNPPADTFHLGQGYWLDLTTPPADLTTTGTPADPAQVFKINLKAGWNLIGDPFPFSIDFQSLNVLDGGASVSIAVAQSGTNPAIGGALWTYEVGQYQLAYTLDPYLGYWIKAYRDVTLLVDPTKRTTKAASNRATVSNVSGNGWTLELKAESNGVRSAPGVVGVHRAATDNFDRFKVETPPSANSGQDVTLTFDHNDWGTRSGRYSKDVRSMTTTNQSWQFTVQSTVSSASITLTWPSIATIPGKNTVVLTDLDSKTTVNLRNRASYVINGSTGGNTNNTVRHFQLDVKRAGRNKLQVSDLTALVNNDPTRGVGAVAISYRLSSAANVQVNVLQGGRKVRTLEPNRSRAEGVAQVTWDMKNDRGTSVPGNLYTIEVKATDDQGNTVRQVGTVLVTR